MSRVQLSGSGYLTRATILALAVLGLTGCVAEPAPVSRADAATEAACRHRADQIYDQQNRGDIYRPPAAVNTPFSSNYLPGVSDRGLSEEYAHEKAISDCVRNTGTGSERGEAGNSGPTPPVRP
jgi:hypothetical protein